MRLMRRPTLLTTIVACVAGLWSLSGVASVGAADSNPPSVDAREMLESGVLALAAGDLTQAELLLTTVVEAARLSGHRGLTFGALTHLAGVRVEQERLLEGLALMAEAIPLADALAADGTGAPPELGVTVRLQLLRLLRTLGSTVDAEAMGWDALGAAVSTGLFEPAVPVLQELIAVAAEQGAGGDELTLRGVEMDELLSGLPGYSESHGGRAGAAAIAELMAASGRGLSQERALEDARAYFTAAMRLHAAAGDLKAAEATCRDLGWVALQLDDRRAAIDLTRHCAAGTHPNGAELALRASDFVDAKVRYEALVESSEPGYERGVFAGRAARASSAVGAFAAAAGHHRVAAAEFREAGASAESASEQIEGAVALLRAGRSVEGGQQLDEGLLAVVEDGRPLHPEGRIRGLLTRSALRASRGSWEAARADVASAGEALFALRRNPGLAMTASEMAWFRLAAGDVDGARGAFRNAVLFEAQAGLLDEGRWGLEGIAGLSAGQGESAAAIEAWMQSMDRADRWTRGRLVPDILREEGTGRKLGEPIPHPLLPALGTSGPRRAVGLLVADGRVEEAFVLSERIRALEWRQLIEADPDPRTNLPTQPDEVAILRIREQVDALREGARGLAFGARDREVEERDIRNRLEVYRVREAEIIEAMDPLRARALAPVAIDLGVVQASLGDRVLLSVFETDGAVVVFRVDSESLVGAEAPLPFDLGEMVSAASASRPRGPARRAARALGDLLLGAHADSIRDRRLVLVLDGALRHIPLDRLEVEKTRLPDLVSGLATLPAAQLAAPRLTSGPPPVDAFHGAILDARPLGRGGPIDALNEVTSSDLVALLASPESPTVSPIDLLDGRRSLPGSVVVAMTPSASAVPELGPGHGSEGVPGLHRMGDGWVALGEIAALGTGVLATRAAGRLTTAAQDAAFQEAMGTGVAPDVALVSALRSLRKRAGGEPLGLRWLAPAGLSP